MSRTTLPDVLLDGEGRVVAWHSGAALERGSVLPFLHVGTEAQARMRGGKVLSRVTIRRAPAVRLRDGGENLWSRTRLLRAARTGAGLVVYLNRHEGVPLSDIAAAARDPRRVRSGRELDDVPDSMFRRLVPSAADSLIVLDPSLIVSIEAVEDRRWDGAKPFGTHA